MKRYIRSSKAGNYTNHFTYNYHGKNFSIYSKYNDDPYNFQCQISELHPYDLAEYRWIVLDMPEVASVIDKGKRIGYIELAEYDEDNYEYDPVHEYIDDIIDYMCSQLLLYNKDIEPIIDRT